MSHLPDFRQLAAWLRLELEPGIGPIHARSLIKIFGDASNLYEASHDELRSRGSEKLTNQISQPLSVAKKRAIEHALRWQEEPGNHILTLGHPSYPKQLAQLDDAPIVLYVRGDLTCLNKGALAIVGARQATADGKERAMSFARLLADRGYSIVSGLAHGIDAAAHRGALSAQDETGTTVAVMGTGADIVYPPSHHALADDILSRGGALISAMRLGTPALPMHFPRRNRIVAGLSTGVLVVEAALRSGSLITAREAADMGREVFAIPGSIRSALSRGPHALIRQGAVLVETVDDIMEELGQPVHPTSFTNHQSAEMTHADSSFPPTQGVLPIPDAKPWRRPCNLSPTRPESTSRGISPTSMEPDSPVWHAIGYDPVSEDTVLRRARISLAEMQTQLLDLLVRGWVEKDAAGRILRSGRSRAMETSKGVTT